MIPVMCRLHAALPSPARRAPIARAHARSCLKCQAAQAREHGLRRELRALGGEMVPAPPYLAAAVMARLGVQHRRSGRRIVDVRLVRAVAAGAGVGAAATAAVVTGLVLRKARTPA